MERQEWLEWRRQGLGGSDAPVIMGVSPWKTRLKLYEEKISTEVVEETRNQWILDKGNAIEGKVRAFFEISEGYELAPALCMMESHPFIRVSLDGYDRAKKVICEIKLVGESDHALALENKIPPKYWPQIQHELMVTGAELCYYLSYVDRQKDSVIRPENLRAVAVKPDVVYIQDMFKKECEFWKCIQDKKPPEAGEQDYKNIRGMSKVSNEYKKLLAKQKEIEFKLDVLKDTLVEAAKNLGHPRVKIGNVKLLQIERAGNVNYKAIPQLQGLDLEQFRGKPVSYWKVDA